MTPFEEMCEAVLTIAERRGLSPQDFAAQMRMIADISLSAAGFDAACRIRIDGAIAVLSPELELIGKRVFNRRGRSIPPEGVA